MKTVSLFLLFAIFSGCSKTINLDLSRNFENAGKQFLDSKTEEDFLAVAAVYESIRQQGVESGALYYNLGNSYLKAGRKGKALAAYRQAERYRPQDPYLQANLRYALGDTALADTRTLTDHLLFWHSWLSYPQKAVWFCVLSFAAFLLASLALLYPKQRPRWVPIGYFALALIVLLGISLGRNIDQIEFTQHGVVDSTPLIARKGNSESYEPAFQEPLAEGTEFTVEEQRGEWLKIRISGKLEGWVRSEGVVIY